MIAKADTRWDEGLTAKERTAVMYYTSVDSESYNNWEQSYLKAGYSQCIGWERNASKVLGKDRVKAAIRQVWDEKADKREMTVARVQAMYMEDRELARSIKQPSAAVSATTGIARLYGMDKDNNQDKIQTPTPMSAELTEQMQAAADREKHIRLANGTG